MPINRKIQSSPKIIQTFSLRTNIKAWKYGATNAGTVQETNLELAGNNTWAICVPNFRYPNESINISNQKDNNDCAYPKFLDWARNRNVSQDWYKYPNEGKVYR